MGPLTESFYSRLDEVLALFDQHDQQPPFTVQRLAEVLVRAEEEYRTTHALLNGLSRILSVQTSEADYEDQCDTAKGNG